MLEDAGFDGDIALIDFPWIKGESKGVITPEDIKNGSHMDPYTFIRSPRTRIVDVTDKLAPEDGYVQGYDEDLGIVTAVGPKPKPKYGKSYYSGMGCFGV